MRMRERLLIPGEHQVVALSAPPQHPMGVADYQGLCFVK